MKATISADLYNKLLNTDHNKLRNTSDESEFLEDHSFYNKDGDLTMDSLPESARFTQSLSFQDFEADLNKEVDIIETGEFARNEKTTHVNLYVQSNSKLKLVLLLSEKIEENLHLEILIKDVIKNLLISETFSTCYLPSF